MVESSLLRLSALFSTSLDPSNEMSDSVGCLRLSYLQLVYLLVSPNLLPRGIG
jgi:hypothetical protein